MGSVFRTSRGAESFDFDLAGKHPLAHVVNNGLQGHRPRKAPVHANRTSPKRPRPKPEETVPMTGIGGYCASMLMVLMRSSE